MSLPFWTLTIPGDPVAQGRPRSRIAGKVNLFVQTYDPPKSRSWKQDAAESLRAQWPREPLEGAVQLIVDAYWRRPKAMKGAAKVPKATRPDAENVAKAIMDAAQGILYRDDAQVVELTMRKWYARAGESPRIELLVARHADAAGLYSHCGAGSEDHEAPAR